MAITAPMMLDAKQKKLRFLSENTFVENPAVMNAETILKSSFWTAEEKEIFKERYISHPKNFGYIASALENKVCLSYCLSQDVY